MPRGKDRLISWLLPILAPHVGKAPLAGRPGLQIRLEIADIVQRQLYFFGYYELGVTRLVHRILREGDTFIDAGANIGYYTLLASPILGSSGSVHGFEPLPDMFLSLHANVMRNGLGNVTMNQKAVFDTDGELGIYPPEPGNMGTGTFIAPSGATATAANCPCTTLDAYAELHHMTNIKLVKMDIEGAEFSALQGMGKILSAPDAPDIICEVSPRLLKAIGRTRQDVIGHMAQYGYQCRQIAPDGLVEVQDGLLPHQRDGWNLFFSHNIAD